MRLNNLQDETLTIPANGRIEWPADGDYLKMKSATDDFTIIYDTGSRFGAGQNFELGGVEYGNITFINNTGSDIEIEFYYGRGAKVDLQDISITNTIKVDDDETQTAIATQQAALEADLTAILSMLQNDQDQRNGLTTLQGASFASAVNTTTTIATAAANTGGVIIRSAYFECQDGSANSAKLRVDGNNITPEASSTVLHGVGVVSDYHIPAGVKVELVSDGASIEAGAWYEIL